MLIIALISLLCSPIYAQQEVTELYTDTGVPTRAGVSESEGFHGTLGADSSVSKKIIGDGGTIITVGAMIFCAMRIWHTGVTGAGGSGCSRLIIIRSASAAVSGRIQAGAGEDPLLAGMETRKSSLDGYLDAVCSTSIVTTGIGYYHDALSSSRGNTASLRFSKNIMLNRDEIVYSLIY